jgi:hypothetical protein
MPGTREVGEVLVLLCGCWWGTETGTSHVKLRELKLKRESEQTRARTRKLGRPTPALEHPTDDKLSWSGGGNSHLLSKPSFIFSM